MAFETNLIALSLSEGEYKIHSAIIGSVDTLRMKEEKILRDVSDETGYTDYGTIFSKADFQKYLFDTDWGSNKKTRDWYASLPKDVAFIVLHMAEWESGLGD